MESVGGETKPPANFEETMSILGSCTCSCLRRHSDHLPRPIGDQEALEYPSLIVTEELTYM